MTGEHSHIDRNNNDSHSRGFCRSAQYFRKDIASAKTLRYRGGTRTVADGSAELTAFEG
jgi:hypothetical protein